MQTDLSFALDLIHAMARGFLDALPRILIALVVVLVFHFMGRMFRSTVRRVSQRRRKQHNLALVLGRLAQATVLFIGVLIGVTIIFPTFSPGDLIALLGVGGVAIGFAFRDIFQNFLAGILILLNEPFRVGDQIVVGGFEGTVEEIQTRATFIRTYDNRQVVIPNSSLYTDKVVVNTAFTSRRTEYDVGIGYSDDVEKARSLLLEAARGAEGVLAEPAPDVLVLGLAESTVNLRLRWWSEPLRHDVLAVQDRVLTAVRTLLPAHGVDLPFPTMQVLFHDQTEETDGDRTRQREGWPAGRGDVPEPARAADAIRSLADATREARAGDGSLGRSPSA